MHDFMTGFAFVCSIVAMVLAYMTHRKVKQTFYIINNRNTRTVTVNHDDGNITVVKEYKNVGTVLNP